jgi:nitrate reductase (cytochrome), electron transfer subunit
MNRPTSSRGRLPQRLVMVGAVTAVMIALILALESARASRHGSASPHSAATAVLLPDEPIAAEAGVFRIRPGDMATDPSGSRRPAAHPRTLVTFRALRAYPGAPPRIPHGLTAEEFRTGSCNTCHEQGGYSPRFGAYVPVTPHPEFLNCLQCHVGDDAVIGTALPDHEPDAICRQCHQPGTMQVSFAPPFDWRPAAWPGAVRRSMTGSPPPIPHDLQLRGNCLACHMGPGAVEEIRTTHPERANCRQCHVRAALEESEFTRPRSR